MVTIQVQRSDILGTNVFALFKGQSWCQVQIYLLMVTIPLVISDILGTNVFTLFMVKVLVPS